SYTSAHSTVSGAAAGILTVLFGGDYHFTVGAESVPYTRSFGSFDAAAAEAGQSRIYAGIHFQFDNQAGLASGQALGQFVVGNFRLAAEGEDEADGGPRGGQAAFRAEGLALLLTGPGNVSAAGAPTAGQPRLLQPPSLTGVPAATSVDE